ncbi:MAG: hypothetical protein ABI895_39490 [Deltaproteobacteria bacterium]
MANIVQWQDLFVILDDGHVSIQEYERLYPLLQAQAKRCPEGLACLVIIPERAITPPSAVRNYLAGMLAHLPIRALGYLVEGTGFKAATVRAVLIGLGIFQRNDCPSKVFTALHIGLGWLLTGPKRQSDVRHAMQAISEWRAESKWDDDQAALEMSRRTSK